MDFPNDNSRRTLLKIASQYEVPAYALEAHSMDKTAAEKVADNLFADIVNRQFPIDSKSNTWWSAAYFNENGHQIKHATYRKSVEDTLLGAAKLYGNHEDVSSALNFTPQEEKTATAQSSPFCYEDAEGRSHFPVADAHGLKLACDCYTNNYNSYPEHARVGIAIGLAKKASEYGEDNLPMCVAAHAGLNMPNRALMVSEMEERLPLIKDAECQAIVECCMDMFKEASSTELFKNASEFAEMVAVTDAMGGLTSHYGTQLLTPHEVCFGMGTKMAEELADSITLRNHTFSMSKLAELSADIFTTALGDDYGGELLTKGMVDREKLAMILPTLPLPDKQVLEDHIVNSCS